MLRQPGSMVAQIRATGADVVLVGVPEFGLVLKPPKFYRRSRNRFGIPYQGDIVSDLLGDRDFKSDTIHPMLPVSTHGRGPFQADQGRSWHLGRSRGRKRCPFPPYLP